MLIKRLLATLLSVSIALPLPGLATVAPATTANKAASEAAFDTFLSQVRAMRAQIDDSQFSLGALIERLDYDPDTIIAFVRDEIRFEPYAGLLRGAEGTLQSRAGNTLDQSLLLAHLLNEAGMDARIVQGHLNEAQAGRLVHALVGTTTPPTPALGHSEAFAPAFKPLLDSMPPPERQQALGQPVTLTDTTVWPAMENGTTYLSGHLQPAGIQATGAPADAALVAHTRDYYWVQYRDAPSQPWASVHTLAQADDLADEGLEISQTLEGDIPAALQHRLRIEMKLERRLGRQTEIVPLMTPWERPAANMAGKRIVVMNAPDALKSAEDLNQPQALEQNTEFLIPLLNGQPAPGAQAFDLSGQTVGVDLLQMDGFGAASLFKQMASHAASATDALGGLSFSGNKEAVAPSRQLLRVWLEYTTIHPDGSERVDVRPLWHHEESPEAVHPVWPLSRQHAISINTGRYAPAYLIARSLDDVLTQEAALRDAVTGREAPSPRPVAESLMELDTYAYFDMGATADLKQQVVYRAEPSLLVSREGMEHHRTAGMVSRLDLDIVHNRRVTLDTRDGSLRSDPAQAMRIGVWETLIEQAMVLRQPGASRAGLDPFPSRVFLAGQPGQTPAILPDAAALAALPADALPPDSRRAVAEDLSRGYVVALDTHAAAGHPPVWWRIDPRSGETLGRNLDGRGGAISERITKEAIWMTALLGVGGAIGSWGACHGDMRANGCSTGGCIGTGIVSGLAVALSSLFLSTALSVKYGVAAGAVVSILYFETGITIMSNAHTDIPTCFF